MLHLLLLLACQPPPTQATTRVHRQVALWELSGNNPGEHIGAAMDGDGDLDGDGRPEVIVGATAMTSAGSIQRALWFPAGPTGLPRDPTVVLERGRGGSVRPGLAFAGDVDADGYEDLVSFVVLEWPHQGIELYRGGPGGPASSAHSRLDLPDDVYFTGEGLRGVGDLDGDGYADVVITIDAYPMGVLLILYGSPTGLDPARTMRVDVARPLRAPIAVAAGDSDGDGIDDLAVAVHPFGQPVELWWYRGRVGGLHPTPDLVWSGGWTALAGVGDVQGDGFDDLVVGASDGADRVFLLAGGPQGPAAPVPVLGGDGALGAAVAGPGDIDGDGYADVVVADPSWSGPLEYMGRLAVLRGGAAGLTLSSYTLGDTPWGGWEQVVPAGDVNGDGHRDVLVTASLDSDGTYDPGRALLLEGGPGPSLHIPGVRTSPALEGLGPPGRAVLARDADADGYDDLFLGDPQAGRVDGYRGGPDGLATTPSWSLAGPGLGGLLAAGDLDGDGLLDLLATAPGRVEVYAGSAGIASPLTWSARVGQVSALAAGDLDGDGADELLVGRAGEVTVWSMTPTGLRDIWVASDPAPWLRWGIRLAVGDLHGDGIEDLLVFGLDSTLDDFYPGRVSLFSGRPGGLAAQPDLELRGPTTADPIVDLAVADLDADGVDDLLLSRGRAIRRLTLHPGGLAGPPVDPAQTLAHLDRAAAGRLAPGGDPDGDGASDLLFSLEAPWRGGGSIGAWLGGAPPAAHPALLWPTGHEGATFGAAGDLDGDGAGEVWTLREDPLSWQLHVWYGGAVPTPGSCGAARADGDGDGLCDAYDAAPADPAACEDADRDGCDDCSLGPAAPAHDGADADGDGLCDVGDPDRDGDGAQDRADLSPRDPTACGDFDVDGCDECSGGYLDSEADGPDGDGDGLCDVSDPDGDGDGVAEGDADPLDPFVCGDEDGDGCEDCLGGSRDVLADGPDPNGNGLCADPWELSCVLPFSQVIHGERRSLALGSSLSIPGDMDGDGFEDAVVVAGGHPSCYECFVERAEGAVRWYRGGPAGLVSPPAMELEALPAGYVAHTGRGDLNGDGYADAAFAGRSSELRSRVLLGGPGGPRWGWTRTSGTTRSFARVISIAGDLDGDGYDELALTEPYEGAGRPDETTGVVLIFRGGPQGPEPSPSWAVASGQPGDRFGAAVLGLGDIDSDGLGDLAIGAPGAADGGAVYVHLGGVAGPGAARWSRSAHIADAGLGGALARGDVDGDGHADLIVGSQLLAFGARPGARLWWFRGDGSSFRRGGALLLDSADARLVVPATGDRDGDGDDDLVVAVSSSPDGQAFEGVVWWLDGSPAGPVARQHTGAGHPEAGLAAVSVGDLDGDGAPDTLLGAAGFEAGQLQEGQLLVQLGRDGLPPVELPPTAWLHDAGGSLRLGGGMAGADVDGDGAPDLVATATGRGLGDLAELWTWRGGRRLDGPPDVTAPAGPLRSVAAVGDIDADGFADVATWQYWASDFSAHEVVLLRGSAAGPVEHTSWNAAVRDVPDDVAALGDVNGDGFDDMGTAFAYWESWAPSGRVHIWHGLPGGPATTPSAQLTPPGWRGWGRTLAGAGDVNGDGYDDVIVGSTSWGCQGGGAATLHLGGAGGVSPDAGWSWTEPAACVEVDVAGPGDLDGDGYDDVVLAFSHDEDPSFRGTHPRSNSRLLVFLGSAAGLGAEPAQVIASEAPLGAGFADQIEPAGDVDGDGLPDLLLHVRGVWRDGAAAVVYRGAPGGLDATPLWQGPCELTAADMVAPLGDIDQDGFADLAVGVSAPAFGSPGGRIYLWYGSPAGPAPAPAPPVAAPELSLDTGAGDGEHTGVGPVEPPERDSGGDSGATDTDAQVAESASAGGSDDSATPGDPGGESDSDVGTDLPETDGPGESDVSPAETDATRESGVAATERGPFVETDPPAETDASGESDASPAESGPFVETDLPAETDALGESDVPPTETDTPGESDASPTETDAPGESDASPTETDATGESDASPTETDTPRESDASPTETDAPADGSAVPADGCGGGCAHTDAAAWTTLLGLLLRRRAGGGPRCRGTAGSA
jgi:hypothetical protein